MRKLYEIFKLLWIQKRIVATATKWGNTVHNKKNLVIFWVNCWKNRTFDKDWPDMVPSSIFHSGSLALQLQPNSFPKEVLQELSCLHLHPCWFVWLPSKKYCGSPNIRIKIKFVKELLKFIHSEKGTKIWPNLQILVEIT